MSAAKSISILDLLLVFVKRRRAILRVTLATAIVSLLVSFLIPKTYTAQTVILTPKETPSMGDLVNGGQGLLSALGGGNSLGLNDPNDTYVTMLRGDAIGSEILDRFQLYTNVSTRVERLKKLAKDTTVMSGHDGTITIKYDSEDPKLAAAVANAYVEALQKLTQRMDVSSAQQRRHFFQVEFAKAKDALAEAELRMRKSMEKSGVLDLNAQAGLALQNIAFMQAQINAKQIEIRAMRTGMTERSPDVVRAQRELATMQAQLADMERKQGGGHGDVTLATSNLPEKGLEYTRALRDVKYYEELYHAMGTQYEAAIADSNATGATVNVVDPAFVPDRKSKPKRALIVIGCTMLMLLLSYSWFLGKELVMILEQDATEGPKIEAIRISLSGSLGRLRAGDRFWRSLRRDRTRAE